MMSFLHVSISLHYFIRWSIVPHPWLYKLHFLPFSPNQYLLSFSRLPRLILAIISLTFANFSSFMYFGRSYLISSLYLASYLDPCILLITNCFSISFSFTNISSSIFFPLILHSSITCALKSNLFKDFVLSNSQLYFLVCFSFQHCLVIFSSPLALSFSL